MTLRPEEGDAGGVLFEGEKATLVFRRRLPHPPERVWKALTDPAELGAWYMTKARIEGRKGGSIDFVSGPSHLQVTGKILEWDPPRVFEHEWRVASRPELPSGEDAIIRWELKGEGSGTLLHLVHRGLGRQTALGFAPGTHAFLDRLGALLGGFQLPDWQVRYQEVAPEYAPSWISEGKGRGEAPTGYEGPRPDAPPR